MTITSHRVAKVNNNHKVKKDPPEVFYTCNFIRKETLARVFSSEFCEISKNTIFTKHVWATASEIIATSISVLTTHL